MARKHIARRREAGERWPTLHNLLACYFNEDYDLLYGSVEGAIVAAAQDGNLEYRRAILKEWRDWNSATGTEDNIGPLLRDAFSVAVRFRKPIEARNFMNRLYDVLIEAVRAETALKVDRQLFNQ